MRKKILRLLTLITASAAVIQPAPSLAVDEKSTPTGSTQQRLDGLETKAFGSKHSGQSVIERIDELESKTFGKKETGAIPERLKHLEEAYGSEGAKDDKGDGADSQKATTASPGTSAGGELKSESGKLDLSAVLAQAVTAYDHKQIEKARNLFQQALTLDPGNVDANFSLGCIAEDRGDFASAESFYKKALMTKPDDGEIKNALAGVQKKKATADPQKQLTDDVSKSMAEFKLGHYDAAKRALTRILQQNPNNDKAHFALAECYRHLGDSKSAVKHFEAAVNLAPTNAVYKSELAKLKGNRPDVASDGAMTFDPQTGVASKRASTVSFAARNLISSARPLVDEVLVKSQNGTLAQLDAAKAQLARIQKAQPDPGAELIDSMLSYHSRGVREAKEGLMADALADYRQAFSQNPGDAAETLELVQLEIVKQDWPMAELHCIAAVACKPEVANNWLDLGLIYLNKNETQKALEAFRVATTCGDSDVASVFLQQAIDNNKNSQLRPTLEKACAAAIEAKKLSAIGVKFIPTDDVQDPSLTAYRNRVLLQLADKWHGKSGGTVAVLSLNHSGKPVSVEVLKSSGDLDRDKEATALCLDQNFDGFPNWASESEHKFIINFDKVKTLADAQ